MVITILPSAKIEDELDRLSDPKYLASLEVIDGHNRADYLFKQKNPDPALEAKEEDNE